MRVVAVTFCVTLAASMAARQGPNNMAAFQVCLQVWMTTSLLADGLAIAGQVLNCNLECQATRYKTPFLSPFVQIQAILARAFAQEDFHLIPAVAARVLQVPSHPSSCLSNETVGTYCHGVTCFSLILQLGLVLGLVLSGILGVGIKYGVKLFTQDVKILRVIDAVIPVHPLHIHVHQLVTFLLPILHMIPVCGSHTAYKRPGFCI